MKRRILDATNTPVALFTLTHLLLRLVWAIAIGLALLSHALGWSYVDIGLTVANWVFVIGAIPVAIWTFLYFVMGIEIETPRPFRLPW